MNKYLVSLLLTILPFVFCQAQDSGSISGSLQDYYTNGPLFGVKVKAMEQGGWEAGRRGGMEAKRSLEFVTMSDEDGNFSLELPAGTYNIVMKRYGLDELAMEGIIISANNTFVLDTALTPIAVPIAGLRAHIQYDNAIVEGTPSGPSLYEKSNDNGVLSDLFSFQETGSQVAVKFDNSDNHIIGGRFFVGDGSFPGPFLGTDVLIRVYDDEGMEGLPGNVLFEDTVTVDQYGWVGFDGLDALALTEHYYLAMVQLNDAPDCAPIGCAQYPANSSSLMKIGDYNWEPFPLGNVMIRAWVAAPHDSLHVTNYRIGRYSSFDPNEGNPQSGILTELATSSYPYYVDNSLYFYPSICYAYGIKALYNNGMYSPYRVSNIIYKKPPFDVSLVVGQSDSSTVGTTRIMLTGQDWPFNNYSSFLQSPGTASLPNISSSIYQVSVFKPGYEKLVLDSVEILSDTLIECLLYEELYPLKDLQVNPFTGILNWEPEFISLFSWQCHADSICHEVTTPELDLTCSYQWKLNITYRYPTDYDPASVDYSTDHGRTWATLYQFSTTDNWDTIQLDLSEFSGIQGESAIMFQVHDLHGAPYYLDISQVKVWSPDLRVHPEQYGITLNGQPEDVTDSTCYQLKNLVNGQSYRAGVIAVYSTGITDTAVREFTYHKLFPPQNFKVIQDGDSLRINWSPPSGSWEVANQPGTFTDSLVGYVLRYDAVSIHLRFDFDSPRDTIFNMARPNCDTATITITALYDLSNYGYPGETVESEKNEWIMMAFGGAFEDYFFEDWSSVNFYHNCWSTYSQGLAIESGQGLPGPALVFENPPSLYNTHLTSFPINIPHSDDASLILEFDLNLFCGGQNGYETFEILVQPEGMNGWDWVQEISNSLGNIDWMHFNIDISSFIAEDQFRIRFKFEGIGAEPVQWKLDNIYVHNICPGPLTLSAELINEQEIRLNWAKSGQKTTGRELEVYNIYRNANDGGLNLLSSVSDTSFTDIISIGGKYCYRISAVYNDDGIICESPLSEPTCIFSTLFIPEDKEEDRVICYPNPAQDVLYVKSEDEIKTVNLYNSLAQNILRINDPGNSFEINLLEMPEGIYFIKIELSDRILFRKFIH
jgi:hypothetical protein